MMTGLSQTTTEIVAREPYAPEEYLVTYDLNKEVNMSTPPVMKTILTEEYTKALAGVFDNWEVRVPDLDGVHRYYGKTFRPGDVATGMTNADGGEIYLYPNWRDSCILLPSAECEGYNLVGWCETADGSTEIFIPNNDEEGVVGVYTPVKDTILYAIWEPINKEGQIGFDIVKTTDPEAEKVCWNGVQSLVVKKGYGFTYRFWIEEQHDFGKVSKIRITPKFFWISEDEAERTEADVYFHTVIDGRRIRFLMAGSREDTRNGLENGAIILDNPMLDETRRSWEAEYSLPVEMFVVSEDSWESFSEYRTKHALTGQEFFFEKTGMLVVHFTIEVSLQGEWCLFEEWNETGVYRDNMEEGWDYHPGDILRYNLAESLEQDYEIGGVE